METITIKGTKKRAGQAFTITRTLEDRDYTDRRNALTPDAKKHADKIIGLDKLPGEDREVWAARWSGCFCSEMDRLARAAGLTGPAKKLPRNGNILQMVTQKEIVLIDCGNQCKGCNFSNDCADSTE